MPEVKQTIIDIRLNASGVRDTARSLHICTNTVLRELKKKAPMLESVHPSLLHTLSPTEVTWDLERAGEAEMDERWSFVGNKGNPRWFWHAIEHHPGEVLAYGFGRPQGTVFLKRIIGGLTRVISTPLSTAQAREIHGRSRGSM